MHRSWKLDSRGFCFTGLRFEELQQLKSQEPKKSESDSDYHTKVSDKRSKCQRLCVDLSCFCFALVRGAAIATGEKSGKFVPSDGLTVLSSFVLP